MEALPEPSRVTVAFWQTNSGMPLVISIVSLRFAIPPEQESLTVYVTVAVPIPGIFGSNVYEVPFPSSVTPIPL